MRRKVPATPSAVTFKAGDAVEVTSDEDGYVGAWFEARVVYAIPQSGIYSVAYDRFVDATDPTRPHEEMVAADHIRPRPPQISGIRQFKFHEAVDVLYEGAWWCGVVVGVGRRRYRVKFAVEVCEYGEQRLRRHLDWNGRKWVVPQLRHRIRRY